jgi:hypothetical protein
MPYKRIGRTIYKKNKKGKWIKEATAKTIENAKRMINRLRMIKYAKKNK